MGKIIAIIAVGILTFIFWGIIIHLLDKKIYNMFYKSKYTSFEEYSQATQDKKNKFTPAPYYLFLVVAFVLSIFCTSQLFSMFNSSSKTANKNTPVETSVTNNEDKQKSSLEDEKKRIEKEKQELEKQKKELEEQKKAAEKEEAQKSSPPPQRESIQSNIPIEVSDGRFEYYGEGALKTLRLKFNVTNNSSRTVYLSMDSFVLRKPGSNAIKPNHRGGGFSDTIDNPIYENNSKDLFSGDTMAVSLDYPVGRLGEGGWNLHYEYINQLTKVMRID